MEPGAALDVDVPSDASPGAVQVMSGPVGAEPGACASVPLVDRPVNSMGMRHPISGEDFPPIVLQRGDKSTFALPVTGESRLIWYQPVCYAMSAEIEDATFWFARGMGPRPVLMSDANPTTFLARFAIPAAVEAGYYGAPGSPILPAVSAANARFGADPYTQSLKTDELAATSQDDEYLVGTGGKVNGMTRFYRGATPWQ